MQILGQRRSSGTLEVERKPDAFRCVYVMDVNDAQVLRARLVEVRAVAIGQRGVGRCTYGSM